MSHHRQAADDLAEIAGHVDRMEAAARISPADVRMGERAWSKIAIAGVHALLDIGTQIAGLRGGQPEEQNPAEGLRTAPDPGENTILKHFGGEPGSWNPERSTVGSARKTLVGDALLEARGRAFWALVAVNSNRDSDAAKWNTVDTVIGALTGGGRYKLELIEDDEEDHEHGVSRARTPDGRLVEGIAWRIDEGMKKGESMIGIAAEILRVMRARGAPFEGVTPESLRATWIADVIRDGLVENNVQAALSPTSIGKKIAASLMEAEGVATAPSPGPSTCTECGLPQPGPHRGTCSHSMMHGGDTPSPLTLVTDTMMRAAREVLNRGRDRAYQTSELRVREALHVALKVEPPGPVTPERRGKLVGLVRAILVEAEENSETVTVAAEHLLDALEAAGELGPQGYVDGNWPWTDAVGVEHRIAEALEPLLAEVTVGVNMEAQARGIAERLLNDFEIRVRA